MHYQIRLHPRVKEYGHTNRLKKKNVKIKLARLARIQIYILKQTLENLRTLEEFLIFVHE